jgi:anti-sigma B factor antagonist
MKRFGMRSERLESGAVVLALRGDLDLQHLYSFEAELRGIEATRTRCIVLDLRELDFVDSSGIRQLLAARRRARRASRRLLLVGGGPPIQRVMALAGLQDVFEIVSDVPAELRAAPTEQHATRASVTT